MVENPFLINNKKKKIQNANEKKAFPATLIFFVQKNKNKTYK